MYATSKDTNNVFTRDAGLTVVIFPATHFCLMPQCLSDQTEFEPMCLTPNESNECTSPWRSDRKT